MPSHQATSSETFTVPSGSRNVRLSAQGGGGTGGNTTTAGKGGGAGGGGGTGNFDLGDFSGDVDIDIAPGGYVTISVVGTVLCTGQNGGDGVEDEFGNGLGGNPGSGSGSTFASGTAGANGTATTGGHGGTSGSGALGGAGGAPGNDGDPGLNFGGGGGGAGNGGHAGGLPGAAVGVITWDPAVISAGIGFTARRGACTCPPCPSAPADICSYLSALSDPTHVRVTTCFGTFTFDTTREIPGPGYDSCRFNGSGSGPGDLSADIQWGYDGAGTPGVVTPGFWYVIHIYETNAGACAFDSTVTPDLTMVMGPSGSTYVPDSAVSWGPFSLIWSAQSQYVQNLSSSGCSGSEMMACCTPVGPTDHIAWTVTTSSATTVEIWK